MTKQTGVRSRSQYGKIVFVVACVQILDEPKCRLGFLGPFYPIPGVKR
jgi:hypothetical protein